MNYIPFTIKHFKYTFGRFNINTGEVTDLDIMTTAERLTKAEIRTISEEKGIQLLASGSTREVFILPADKLMAYAINWKYMCPDEYAAAVAELEAKRESRIKAAEAQNDQHGQPEQPDQNQ